jgi:hypothetical protein
MRVDQCHHQCVGSVGFRQVKVGAGFDQDLHRRHCPLARGEEQRRQTTTWTSRYNIPVARPLRFLRPFGRASVDIRAGFDERLHDLGAIFSGGPHEGGLTLPGLARVDHCTVLKQSAHGFSISGAGGRH